MKNVMGERFDLMKAGQHVLISVPRGASAEGALLRVQADARRLGKKCSDMYFQEINITGSWAEESHYGGFRFLSYRPEDRSDWMVFGPIQMKVTHAHTVSGLQYLNFHVKHLSHAGFAIGGLLGEDDHKDAATPSGSCVNHISLAAVPADNGDGGSNAEASLA